MVHGKVQCHHTIASRIGKCTVGEILDRSCENGIVPNELVANCGNSVEVILFVDVHSPDVYAIGSQHGHCVVLSTPLREHVAVPCQRQLAATENGVGFGNEEAPLLRKYSFWIVTGTSHHSVAVE